jgi:hypothetical protein
MSKNLVITSVGDSSLHNHWIEAKEFKNFDLFLIYFGNNRDVYFADCDYYAEDKGYKFPLLYKHLISYTKSCYDYFFLPDEDILMHTADINLLFEQMKESNYFIAQPSLKKDCPHTWPHTTTKIGNVSRETKFVEIMCPIFTIDALNLFLPYFNKTHTGWGLDALWSTMTLQKKKKLGIFDIVSVAHQRAMGKGNLYTQLKKDGIDYKQEYQDFLKKYNLQHTKQNEKREDW